MCLWKWYAELSSTLGCHIRRQRTLFNFQKLFPSLRLFTSYTPYKIKNFQTNLEYCKELYLFHNNRNPGWNRNISKSLLCNCRVKYLSASVLSIKIGHDIAITHSNFDPSHIYQGQSPVYQGSRAIWHQNCYREVPKS